MVPIRAVKDTKSGLYLPSRRDFLKLAGLSAIIAACDKITPTPSKVQCPFNPAVDYAWEKGILSDYDIASFGTSCFWNPDTDGNKSPEDFLKESTKNMIDWMGDLDADSFYTRDQIQSLVTRFGEGIINPETGQKVLHDTGLVNIDEYLASREFYEQAKDMHEWAIANEHLADSIIPEHYTNFNAWSIRLFGWPYIDSRLSMPKKDSAIEFTGLEPSAGLIGLSTVNWGLSDYGTADYELLGFIAIEGTLLEKENWAVCGTVVEDGWNSSQNFVPDNQFLREEYGLNVLVQSMMYSPGLVVRKLISTPGPPVDWYDMTIQVEHPVSATLMDIGGYLNGHRLTISYAHISGEDGNMDDSKLPDLGDIIPPRSVFSWLNRQRPYLLGDFQGYVPKEATIPGPYRPGFPERTQVDMFLEALPPGKKAGWNDPRANRHDTPTNYATAIGNRSIFAPCVRAPGLEGDWIHQPQ